jgi:bifunctional ADP-heptose synthase (sugar kinase/adenylyltransferase)
MSLFDDRGVLDVPTQAREVFDVTGAGDTVIATLATMLACGLELREAVEHANRAAGMVVGKFGTARRSRTRSCSHERAGTVPDWSPDTP